MADKPAQAAAPKPCIWEGRPAFWRPGEAWALVDGAWEAVNSSDVGMSARPVSEAALLEMFPDTPPMPPEAFQKLAPPARQRRSED